MTDTGEEGKIFRIIVLTLCEHCRGSEPSKCETSST